MPVEPAVLSRLARLGVEMDADRVALTTRARETVDLLERWGREGTLSRESLIVLAVNLHGWYTALETLLERAARLFDQSVPSGPAWHVDLLAQMAVDVPSLRPALLEARALADLHELRRFRHFFRNAYVLDLDPARVRGQAERLRDVRPSVDAALDRFGDHVRAVLASLAAASP